VGEQEFIFNLEEMHRVGAICRGCGTEIIFDAAQQDTGLPDRCSVCHGDIKLLGQCFGLYRQFYRRMTESGEPIRVRVLANKQ